MLYQIVHFFVLDMCCKLYFAQKLLRKANISRARLLQAYSNAESSGGTGNKDLWAFSSPELRVVTLNVVSPGVNSQLLRTFAAPTFADYKLSSRPTNYPWVSEDGVRAIAEAWAPADSK